jgi:hypothetical protein
MRWAGHVARMREKRHVDKSLVGKPEGKRPLGRPRSRWLDNIKMDLVVIGLSVVDWIGLAQDRYRWKALVNAVMNLRVPQNAGKLPSGCTTCVLSSGTQLQRDSFIHIFIYTYVLKNIKTDSTKFDQEGSKIYPRNPQPQY